MSEIERYRRCTVTRHDGSAGSPVASFVTWAIALSCGHGMAAVSTNSGEDGDGSPSLPGSALGRQQQPRMLTRPV